MARLSTRGKVGAGLAGGAVLSVIAAITAVEGGYVNNRNDPGGATNHGITEKVARQHGYRGDMRALPRATAQQIYFDDYIRKPGFGAIIAQSAALGREVADQGVNFGPHRPSCYFQRALNALNRQGGDYADVRVDCKIGATSIGAYRALETKRGDAEACRLMVKLMDAQQASEYLRMTKANPRLEQFMPGWIGKRIGNVDLGRCAGKAR